MSPTSFVRSVSSLAVLATMLLMPVEGWADPIKFMRDPHIANGMIVFSYHGDIWIARENGTQPRRLTHHVARDIAPRFSPDGRWVAFTSNRFANNDVFLVSVSGGEPTQLTFHSGSDVVAGWTPDGQHIMFVTARGTHPFYSPMYTVPVAGGIPVPMDMDQARDAMVNQAGTMVAFNRNPVSTSRKEQRGNRTTNMFVQDLATKAITQLTDTDRQEFRNHTHDAIPMWGADGMVYFMSERDGIFNIWKIAPAGGAPTQVTRHAQGGVKYPSISPDGRTIIYTNDHELWTVDVPNGQPQKLTVDLSFDPTTNLVEYLSAEDRADGMSPSPNGDFLAVDYRGEVFLVPTDDDVGEKTQVTRSAWRERYARYSPDGRHLAYISDEGLEEELWVYNLEDGSRRKLSTHESQKTGNYTWSPEGDRIAYVAANRLFQVNIETGRTTELGYNQERGFNLAQYSPDGNWLLYDRRNPDLSWQVYLLDIANRREHDLTRHPFRNSDGRLTPDGKTLVFASNRDNGTTHLFKTSLARHAEDPDDPLVKARRSREDAEDAEPQRMVVNADGIDRRAVQLTRGENGIQSYFLSADGETVFFTSRDEDGPALFSAGIDGEGRKKVASGTFTRITPTKDRKSAFYFQNPEGTSFEVHKISFPSGEKEQVRFSFRVPVDHRAEWEQIFEKSWRVMKYRFYDENMHGKDWDAIKAAYKPLLPHVGTYEDLYDLANQMIGELNASHVGVRGAPSRPMEDQYQTKFLGVELEPADGRYQVSHVYRDGPADKEWLDLEVGDYVLAIDGQEIQAGENYWNILNHALNEYVPIQVADSPNGTNRRQLRIKTVTSMRDIRYEEWVATRRDIVERESDGKIAYVHIRAMNRPSLARFENEIDEYWNAQGIVVDIRYNGGGNIDQQLLDILERRPYEYWNNRWASRASGRRPRQAIAGPKVMLINHRSGSDSEVTPKGFRDLGLGRIVGNPTAAAVIATGSYRLIHGGTIRTPGSLVVAYDPTKPNNYGVNLENYGVGPDVWAVNTPEDELNGFDRELKAAVDEALRMLAEGKWQFTTEEGEGSRGGR